MDEPPVISLLCACGQINPEQAAQCVRCGKPLADSAIRTRMPPTGSGLQFSLASLMLVITIVAVVLGLFVVAPGLGILFGILALPALIRTVLVVQKRKQLGKEVAGVRKVLLFVGSFGVTFLITTTVIVASFGAFVAVCLMTGTKGQYIPEPTLLSFLIGGLVFFGSIALFALWIKRRWRRDTTKP